RYGDTIEKPGADPDRYREALEKIAWAYEIGDIGRDSMDIVPNLLGIAQYRCGQFREALATLTKPHNSTALSVDGANNPTELAVLAMSRARFGQIEAARATLDQLERLMQDSKLAEGPDNARNRSFLREAEELLLDHGFPADPFAP